MIPVTLAKFTEKHDFTRAGYATPCWIWNAAKDRDGYGVFMLSVNDFVTTKTRYRRAHRAAYEHFVGPVPEGLTLDHLCRNRDCVRPDHLQPVSVHENTMRGVGITAINAAKTHCGKGHEFVETNMRRDQDGNRVCVQCARDATRAYQRRMKARPAALAAFLAN